MFKRSRRLVPLTLMTTVLLSGAMQDTAHAATVTPLDSICDPNWACMWEDENYFGDRYDRSGVYQHFYDIGWWNGDNEISSVKNRSSWYLCLYAGDSPSSDYVRIAPGQFVPSLGDAFGFDNDAESLKFTSGSC